MSLAEQFHELFRGDESAYGTYDLAKTSTRLDGKKTGKAKTVREPVTDELWDAHLKGEQSLGIITINETNECHWAGIDVDVYPVDFEEVLKRIRIAGLPIVVAKSKSNGAHLFFFFKKAEPAEEVQPVLKDIASRLGYGTCEVFPKQTQILHERGDLGNWLNMPYFGETRLAMNDIGTLLTYEEFLVWAYSQRTNLDDLEKSKSHKEAPSWSKVEPQLKNGPPCLQHLASIGLQEGGRNDGLLAFSVFARKAYPDTWQERVEAYNREFTGGSPVNNAEMSTILKSAGRKDYKYRCAVPPINAHCNSGMCRTKKYGIRTEDGMPIFSGLTKLNTDQPLWFLDIEGGGRLELMTEELQNQTKFQKKCMDALNAMPQRMKEDQWQSAVQALMANVVVVEAPPEASVEGYFQDLLESFCTDRAQAHTSEEILLGKPFSDEGKTYFRLRDLDAYLNRLRFTSYTRTQMSSKIRKMGGGDHFFNVKGHGIRCLWIPSFWVQKEGFDIPEMDKGAF